MSFGWITLWFHLCFFYYTSAKKSMLRGCIEAQKVPDLLFVLPSLAEWSGLCPSGSDHFLVLSSFSLIISSPCLHWLDHLPILSLSARSSIFAFISQNISLSYLLSCLHWLDHLAILPLSTWSSSVLAFNGRIVSCSCLEQLHHLWIFSWATRSPHNLTLMQSLISQSRR